MMDWNNWGSPLGVVLFLLGGSGAVVLLTLAIKMLAGIDGPSGKKRH